MGDETKRIETGLYEDTYEAYPLAKEWVEVLDEMSETEEGLSLRKNDQALREYIWTTSDEMAVIKEAIADGTFNTENVTGQLARAIYYAHPSLVDMTHRTEALELAAFGMAKEIREIPEQDQETRNIRMRRLASVLEELGETTTGTSSKQYEEQSLKLNQLVWDSDLDIARSPRKLHAGFSVHDIHFRRMSRAVMKAETEAEIRPFEERQALCYRDAAQAINSLRSAGINQDDGRNGNASGALGEVLTELFLRDMKIASGDIFHTDVSQSYIRQDKAENGGLRLPVHKRVAFDLRVTDLRTGSVKRIEVKKRTQGELPEIVQRKQDEQLTSYVPLVKVVELRVGYTLDDYLRIAEDHCTNMYHLYTDSGISTNRQIRATRIIASQLEEALEEV